LVKQEREQRQKHAWAQSIAAEACEAEHLVADLYLGIEMDELPARDLSIRVGCARD
jgi:hypothetical protein